jgi:hypothetical protein
MSIEIGTIATTTTEVMDRTGTRSVTRTHKVVGLSETVEGLYRIECISDVDATSANYLGAMGWAREADLTVVGA